MNHFDATNAFLKDKKDKALDIIKNIPLIHEIDEIRITLAKQIGRAVTPSLDMSGRSVTSIQEVPTYHPSGAISMAVGQPYNGIQVTIPVLGDSTLFAAFLGNRSICDGFTHSHKAIKIKQYDYQYAGLDEVKGRIKACVDSLQQELQELEKRVENHNASLKPAVEAAAAQRKQEILDKQQQDKDADPWG